MSDAPPPTDIQFDRAEFKGEHAPVACASCGAAIGSTYYQVGQAITCEQCRWRLDVEGGAGSAIGRFLKATLFGTMHQYLAGGKLSMRQGRFLSEDDALMERMLLLSAEALEGGW